MIVAEIQVVKNFNDKDHCQSSSLIGTLIGKKGD